MLSTDVYLFKIMSSQDIFDALNQINFTLLNFATRFTYQDTMPEEIKITTASKLQELAINLSCV